MDNKDSFICIPTGFQSKQLIIDNGLRLGTIEQYPDIDIAFDGADEVDPQLNLIKGGGACLFQEKLVAASAKNLLLLLIIERNLINWDNCGDKVYLLKLFLIHIVKSFRNYLKIRS